MNSTPTIDHRIAENELHISAKVNVEHSKHIFFPLPNCIHSRDASEYMFALFLFIKLWFSLSNFDESMTERYLNEKKYFSLKQHSFNFWIWFLYAPSSKDIVSLRLTHYNTCNHSTRNPKLKKKDEKNGEEWKCELSVRSQQSPKSITLIL